MATTLPYGVRYADLLLDGKLEGFIRERREADPQLSWDRIARDLWVQTDGKLDPTGPTVQDWFDRLTEAVA